MGKNSRIKTLHTTYTKMNMRNEPFEKTLRTGNFGASSNWGAYSF